MTEEAVVKTRYKDNAKKNEVRGGRNNEITMDNQTTVKLNDLSFDSGGML